MHRGINQNTDVTVRKAVLYIKKTPTENTDVTRTVALATQTKDFSESLTLFVPVTQPYL